MKKYIIKGGDNLEGSIAVSGAKNVVLPALVAACLTEEEVELKNVPLIADFFVMIDLIREIGGDVEVKGHSVKIKVAEVEQTKIPLDAGAKIRTSSMFVAPLLARAKEAFIPNPGGCRIGARPIDRHIEGLEAMGVSSVYRSEDGYFHLKTGGLEGARYKFTKNTHTGTEVLIMAAVLAKGQTVIENAAQEPEVDDLIALLSEMGADIKRSEARTIVINGVEKLHGTSYSIMPDRNEVVTFAVLSALTGGKILIENVQEDHIGGFLELFRQAGGSWEKVGRAVRFYVKDGIKPTDVATAPHPGFMTDWQGPWAVFMTQANGESTIHETVYESRFGYVDELKKMGAELEFYEPKVDRPSEFYNFNYEDHDKDVKQGLRIHGATPLHNGVLNISDLRAGATLVIGSLLAKGESIIHGIEYLERGYEDFDARLRGLGAKVEMVGEEEMEG